MKYNAMPGSIIIQIADVSDVVKTHSSGLMLVEKTNAATTTVADVLSVGDEREDLKPGMKILFPSNTGLMIAKNIYYLRYEDICATISE